MLKMHRGSESAAETLWAHFASPLTGYARLILPRGMESSAEDVVQGVFVKVLKMRRRSLRNVRDGTAFLYRVTRNETLNAGRGELRQQKRQAKIQHDVSTTQVSDEVHRMLAAIEQLAIEQREVILLRYIRGLTIDQVSETVGVNRNTVASRGRIGMARLRETLGAETDGVCDG